MTDGRSPNATEMAVLQAAARLMSSGDPAGAVQSLDRLLATNPYVTDAHHLKGRALCALGRIDDAEAALREALRLTPNHSPASVALGEVLTGTDRAQEAYALLQPFTALPGADIFVLTAAAQALKALRRYDDAIALYERARRSAPASGVAEHNLAGALGDVQRYAEAEEATRRAFGKGLDAPETWLVRGRALQGLGRNEEAIDAFGQAIKRRSAYADAHGDLAQLIWMTTEDPVAAGQALGAAIARYPAEPQLWQRRARLAEYAQSPQAAYQVLQEAPEPVRRSPQIEAAAALYACRVDPAAAMAHASRAFAAAPEDLAVTAALCQAQLASGEGAAAERTAMLIRQRWSLNQEGVALLATAWRMTGDEAYRQLYDYEHLVKAHLLDTPEGWGSLEAYLADLAGALDRSHLYRGHPVGQSLRSGAQLPLSPDSSEPAIAAFFEAVRGPIQRHIAALGSGDDPLRARITGASQYNGIWSVRLRPGGYHVDHIHPMGWLSSACYIALPEAVGRGREGWIKFGQPGVATATPLDAEHYVRPEPGTLVLFPSYMWHGTVPFTGEDPRLTIAFDLLPR
jgi:tetratricopeptide (TPR) repeat protein